MPKNDRSPIPLVPFLIGATFAVLTMGISVLGLALTVFRYESVPAGIIVAPCVVGIVGMWAVLRTRLTGTAAWKIWGLALLGYSGPWAAVFAKFGSSLTG